MKYKVGDKVRLIKLDSTEKLFGLAGGMKTVGFEVDLKEDNLDATNNSVDIGIFIYSLDDFELVVEQPPKNYRELTPDTLIDISIDGNEFKVPLGDLIHAQALIGVGNGKYGYNIYNALKDVLDKEEVNYNSHDYEYVDTADAQEALFKSYFIDKEKEAKKQALKEVIEKQREEIAKLEQQLIVLDDYDGCSL